MKRKHWRIIICIIIGLSILWYSNPTDKDYISHIKNNYKNYYTNSVNITPDATEHISKKIEDGEYEYDIMNKIAYKYHPHLFLSTAKFIEYSATDQYIQRFHIGILGFYISYNYHYYSRWD
jgi:hypothetical protein